MAHSSLLFPASACFLVVSCAAAGDGSAGSGQFSGDGSSGAVGGSGSVQVGSGGSGANGGSGAGISVGGTDTGSTDPDCDNILEVTYRDFDESHPDMEMAFAGDVVRIQLLEPTLGADGKPVFKSSTGCPRSADDPLACDNWQTTNPVITSAATFDQWYRTSDVNREIPGTLELTPDANGYYVFDTNAFFPLGPDEGFGITPANNDQHKNFLFTTEIHVTFTYRAGQVFSFRGDDDLWIFVNGTLAMDLGGMHSAETGTIDFDAQSTRLGITPGSAYPMDIFHAERHTRDSNFRFETNVSCFVPVVVR